MAATMMVATYLLTVSVSAHATTWWTWYSSTTTPEETWKSKSVGQMGPYNKLRASTAADLGAQAYASASGVGSAHAPQSVTMSFSYQRGTFKCKWSWYGSGKGPLTCKLGYN